MESVTQREGGTYRLMLRLALPVMAEELLNLLVGSTDWWLVGRYVQGVESKAAMGLMAYLLWMIPVFFEAVGIGATALIARMIGSGDQKAASAAAAQSLTLGAIIAALAMVLLYFTGDDLVRIMGLAGKSAQLAELYLSYLVWSIPFIMCQRVCSACLRGAGNTVSGSIATLVVVIVNVLISTSLVIGLGPMPELGWQGLAIGTTCGHAVGGLTLLWMLIRGRRGIPIESKALRLDVPLAQRLLRIGIPGGIDVLLIVVFHLVYARIIYQLGDLARAAHGLGVQIEALAYLPGNAFQVAAATLVGQYLGAQRADLARRAVWASGNVGALVMCAAGVLFFFGGHGLAAFFSGGSYKDPTAMETARLLKIVAFSELSLAITMIVSGALRGAGDTRWPLMVSLVGLVGVRIPLAIVLAWPPTQIAGFTVGMDYGVAGAWLAMVIDLAVRAILLLTRFLGDRWQRISV